jgi:queuosine precursor transporter
MHLPRSLFVYSILYGGMTCIAGVLGNKQVALGAGLAVEAGIFAFLMLVVLSSATAELHGRAVADRLVRFGFVPLIFSMALIVIVLGLPAAGDMDPARLSSFQLVLGQSPRLMLAGIIAYGISQTLNVAIFSRLKGDSGQPAASLATPSGPTSRGGRFLWARAAVASILSQIVDTLLFITIAFYGVFPIERLLVGQALAKVVLSAVIVPPVIYAAVAIGQRLDRREAAA